MTATLNRKPLFDRIRELLGRGFTQSEVAAIDDAIDAALIGANMRPEPPSSPENGREVPAQTTQAGIDLIHHFEQFRSHAYPDPGSRDGKPVTIGWGSTTDERGLPIQLDDVWSRERADERFSQHLLQFERWVIDALGSAIRATSQAQFDALVSFTYNVGPENFRASTLLRKHKAGDYKGAAREFRRWNKNDGRVLRGLTRRRAAEEKLYRSGM